MAEDIESLEKKLYGIGGSPGICIGKAYLVDKEGIGIVKKYHVDDVESEIYRFENAVSKAVEQLREIIDQISDELKQHARIIDTHVVLLQDEMLHDRTIETIKNEKVNAEWALKKVVAIIKSAFETINDNYLRARADDITHVSNRILENLTGGKGIDIGKIDKRVILVTRSLSPAETSQIQLERIKAFVTDRGGYSSHTSIIARTLELPAVVGMAKGTSIINNDDMLIVNGITGVVTINPDEQTLIDAEIKIHNYQLQKAVTKRQGKLPATTKNGITLSVMGNIGLPEEIASVLSYGGDGIGLYRTEFQYIVREDFPSEEDLFEGYKDVVDVARGMPVTIRTLDINGDNAVELSVGEDEVNPALGLRAIRYCLKKTDIFKTQLKAILRASLYGNVRVLIPMISTIEEVQKTKILINEAKEFLEANNVAYKDDIPIGIMIEVPSAVATADILADVTDFFSIGTNDLIQYAMAIDRSNVHVADLYQPLNPAILRMIKHVCNVGEKKGVKVCMCGEMAGDPLYIPVLLGLGVDEFSMNPQSIPAVKNVIRQLDTRETKRIAEEVMKLTTSTEIGNFIRNKEQN